MTTSNQQIKATLKVFILLTLLFLFITELKRASIDLLIYKAETIFKGKVSIEKIGLGLNGVFLKNIAITDSTKQDASLFVSIGRLEIPLTVLIKHFEPYIFIYDFHINLDNAQRWNILKNFKNQKEQKKQQFNFPTINLKIFESSANVDLHTHDRQLFAFRLKKTNGTGTIKESKLSYDAAGIENHFGVSLSRGVIDFSTQHLTLTHNFPEVELSNPFVTRFLKALFSFFEDFEFKGKLNLTIPNIFKNRHWLSPHYELVFDKADFLPQHLNWKLKSLSGKLDAHKHKLHASKGEGKLQLNRITIPFKDFTTEGTIKPGVCIFFDPIAATTFSGKFKGNYTFMYGEKYFSSLAFTDQNLQQVVQHISDSAKKDWRGLLTLTMQLAAAKADNWKLKAVGKASIDQSNLYELPLFVGIFNFLNFKLPKKEKITSASADWYTSDAKLFFQNIKIKSQTTSFYGQGNIDSQDNLDFHFAIRLNKTTLLSLTPIIGEITRKTYNKIMKELVAIRTTGTLEKPHFSRTPIEKLPTKMVELVLDMLNPFGIIESLLEKD